MSRYGIKGFDKANLKAMPYETPISTIGNHLTGAYEPQQESAHAPSLVAGQSARVLGLKQGGNGMLLRRTLTFLFVLILAACSDDKTGPDDPSSDLENLAGAKFSLVAIDGQNLPAINLNKKTGCEVDGVYNGDAIEDERIDGGYLEFMTNSRYAYELVAWKRCRPAGSDPNNEDGWDDSGYRMVGDYQIEDGKILMYFFDPNPDNDKTNLLMVGNLVGDRLTAMFLNSLEMVFERQ